MAGAIGAPTPMPAQCEPAPAAGLALSDATCLSCPAVPSIPTLGIVPSSSNWAAVTGKLPTKRRGQVPSQTEWEEVVGGRELSELLRGARDALDIKPPLWLRSVLGPPPWLPLSRFSDLGILYPWRPVRAATYLADILVPSLPMTPPAWLPEVIAWPFLHPSRIRQRPDHNGSWASHPREAWFFVNGILTNDAFAQLNAAYLAHLFHRPVTLVQNSTGGALEDLVECARDKAFGATAEAATKAFPPIYDALKDPDKDRVVVIAHSQGTIIAGVLLRFMRLLYRRDEEQTDSRGTAPPAARRAPRLARAAAEPEDVPPDDMPLDPTDFEPLTDDEVAKLELYCFANCATKMPYLGEAFDGRPIPWIESYGNQFDIVARLGMLAPNPDERGVEIKGPRYERKGAWGHLLNEHYLRGIEQEQKNGRKRGPSGESAKPYVLINPSDHPEAEVPRLFRYINGGFPPPRVRESEPAAQRPRGDPLRAARRTAIPGAAADGATVNH